jgi:hypothetical protein
MTRREASEALLAICIRQSRELNDYLLAIQGKVGEEDFLVLRRRVGSLMSELYMAAVGPILVEYPELTPEGLDLSE